MYAQPAYLGTRVHLEDVTHPAGEIDVWFEEDGLRYELEGERPFNWGYSGGGPYNLAAALLRHRLGACAGKALFDPFRYEVVARFQVAGFRYTVAEFDAWLLDHHAQRVTACAGMWHPEVVRMVRRRLESWADEYADLYAWEWLGAFGEDAETWIAAGWCRPNRLLQLIDAHRVAGPAEAAAVLRRAAGHPSNVRFGFDPDAPARALISSYERWMLPGVIRG